LSAGRCLSRRRLPRPPPLLWPAEPPWAWAVPGLLRVGAAPPPLLLSAPAVGWPVPCEPLLPLLAEHPPPLHGQWIFGAHSPVVGFSPSSGVEFVPVFPPVYTSAVPPHAGKSWIDKRLPSCKIYLNNAFAVDSAWMHPEEPRLFQGSEKPLLMTNQVAMAIARPAPASRPLPTVVLAPPLMPGGCRRGPSPVGSPPSLALLAVEAEAPPGPPPSSIPQCRLLTLSPLRIPVLGSPFPDNNSLMRRLYLLTNLCLSFKDHSFKLVNEDDSTSNGNKPVASTPVPGSPWCVVWTGDDRVFFFNPTMQLSVWEKPVDLRHRGDINRILEDPPHKRKLDAAAKGRFSLDGREDFFPQRNGKPSAAEVTPPLEERITHFRDMLLERGVSAFSTWEKELHKIVFDPRYLLLNSEERKQVKEAGKDVRSKLSMCKVHTQRLQLSNLCLSCRTTFKEFAEKYGRDQRFRLVQKKKDQEHFFNQFILILKKRDKENRIRLRKMR
uniref:Transcription elongation regulator 1 like n=1 Tax=Pavo cristatus TaxID=9049 RepID=A0A8C9EXA3_PAVCR